MPAWGVRRYCMPILVLTDHCQGSTYRLAVELVWNTVRDMEALECSFYGDIHLYACRGITGETFVMPETVGKPERDADIM